MPGSGNLAFSSSGRNSCRFWSLLESYCKLLSLVLGQLLHVIRYSIKIMISLFSFVMILNEFIKFLLATKLFQIISCRTPFGISSFYKLSLEVHRGQPRPGCRSNKRSRTRSAAELPRQNLSQIWVAKPVSKPDPPQTTGRFLKWPQKFSYES